MHLLASKYIAPKSMAFQHLKRPPAVCGPALSSYIRIFYCMDVRYELYRNATIIKGNKILDIPDAMSGFRPGSHIHMALGLQADIPYR